MDEPDPQFPRETVLRSRVPPSAADAVLVDWLAMRFRYLDHEAWRAEIAAGRVSRDGAIAGPDDRLAAGDLVAYRPPHAEPRSEVPIEPLHDGPDFVVVGKPAHLVAHLDGAFVQNTFVRALERFYARRGEHPQLALVHRLDRETTGLLLLAKTREANRALQGQFAAGTVRKEYLAVVHGVVSADAFEVAGAIGPDASSALAIRRAVQAPGTPGARSALTRVRVERRFAEHTLLRVEPSTGRTHQIRVHLTHVGHPLVGDKLYGRSDAEYLEYVAHLKADGDPAWGGRLPTGRQMLHAERLEFDDPAGGTRLHFVAPVPADMHACLRTLDPRGVPSTES